MTDGRERFRFLYRQSEGVIGPAEWRRWALPPIGLAAGLTGIWLLIAPSGPRDMATQPFFDLGSVATYSYFLLYVLALLLCSVAYYFLSAKRLSDIGLPQSLAALPLMALFLAMTWRWYQPRSEETAPEWTVWVLEIIAAAALFWTAAILGWRTRSLAPPDSGGK